MEHLTGCWWSPDQNNDKTLSDFRNISNIGTGWDRLLNFLTTERLFRRNNIDESSFWYVPYWNSIIEI